MSIQQVHSCGIYHGLPVFPLSIKNLTAIITGANGISGAYMLKVLSQSPQRWSKIYCLSRRPPLIPGGLPSNVEHIALDFLKDPDEIADVLKEKGVKADYVFFYSYIQPPPKPGGALWSDAEEMVRVNVLLLSNFLAALKMASITPKTFMLQTGAKNYGGHLGNSLGKSLLIAFLVPLFIISVQRAACLVPAMIYAILLTGIKQANHLN
jgi:nucleoside-diphosphate-sugar epimerase